jgi:Cyclic nucleotide-binding domain
MKTLREKIGKIRIFSGLTPEDQAKLLDKMEQCFFTAGAIIFSQGDPSDAFYFIESGAVQVAVKKRRSGKTGSCFRTRTAGLVWRKRSGYRAAPFRNRDYGQRNCAMEAQPRRLGRGRQGAALIDYRFITKMSLKSENK